MRLKSILIFLLSIFILVGCGDSEKVKDLKYELREAQSTNSRLWNQRAQLREELYSVKTALEKSNKKISSFQKDQQFTKDMIALLASGQIEDAIKIAKSINQGWFDEIDRQIIFQNKLLADMKREEMLRKEKDKIQANVKIKNFIEFMTTVFVWGIQLLVASVVLVCLILMGFLIYKGVNIYDQLVRAGGVLSFLIIYFVASFYGYSISSLMLNSAMPLLWKHTVQEAVPLVAGITFAIIIKYQIAKEHFYAERWVIVITTLLFCTLLDVFLNVEMNVGNHTLSISNVTFVVGLSLTLFFYNKPQTNIQTI
ncbi:hypothetical protein QJU89_02735 [Pasteurella skyensis]|uniref:Uncharacterized protein n=1 Tax=Phocoenobacter skyensis TaxID=97481 RepID=A0AAJ6N8Y9_9PAST|nr:hypothetical protein [Pasteurella skyensis]MDP8162310.1 hypothetical protein [Pasteurella skyensis]MDP8172356.1 hypothetical protein [Pasteurella skyensis]MDP8177011.1 hypothetical protein [Pasteurella skyensis]MDP8178611.1 hypothetical protein [Pasteurella skyensis]MDP8182613.1 hypothetical protein [Pasteurella skyensis]